MQEKLNITSSIWRGVKLFFKWLWLVTMFLLGIVMLLAIPIDVFEYSFSLSELDLIETLFFMFLCVFVYQYLKLCLRVDVPLIWKIISPWVHQAHLLLVVAVLYLVSIQLFGYKLEDFERMPLLSMFEYILMAGTMGYSYYRLTTLHNQRQTITEKVCKEGVTE